MCERCDAPQGSLDETLDWRLGARILMAKQERPYGELGYWIGVVGLIALLGVIFINAVGL